MLISVLIARFSCQFYSLNILNFLRLSAPTVRCLFAPMIFEFYLTDTKLFVSLALDIKDAEPPITFLCMP